MLGRQYSRRQLETLVEDNFCSTEDLIEKLSGLEAFLGIEWTGDEYKKKAAKRGRKPGTKAAKTAKADKKTKAAKATKATKTTKTTKSTTKKTTK